MFNKVNYDRINSTERMPDISGFSKFLNESAIEHSTHIIRELLEIIINANEINLEVMEIEGDAVFFYRFGKTPGIHEIIQQSKNIFKIWLPVKQLHLRPVPQIKQNLQSVRSHLVLIHFLKIF